MEQASGRYWSNLKQSMDLSPLDVLTAFTILSLAFFATIGGPGGGKLCRVPVPVRKKQVFFQPTAVISEGYAGPRTCRVLLALSGSRLAS